MAAALTGAWREGPDPWNADAAEVALLSPLLLRSGSAALAWRRLPARSAGAAQSLRAAARQHALEAALHERQLAETWRLFAEAGLQPLLGKGWAAARLYPEPALRPYGDIDLYLPDEELGAAHALLERHGLGHVDLHARAELDDRPWSELVRRAQTAHAGDTPVRVLGAEHHLRLLALHLLRHGAWRPLWLCDVAALVEATGPSLDWDELHRGESKRTAWVLAALALARDLLGARVPAAAAAPEALPPWLPRAVLAQWGRASFEPQGARRPLRSYLRRPRGLGHALRIRWPDPVEATMDVGARPDPFPRLPVQLAACVVRTARALRRSPR